MMMAANIYPIQSHIAYIDHSRHPHIVVLEDHISFGISGAIVSQPDQGRVYRLLELYFPPRTNIRMFVNPESNIAGLLVNIPIESDERLAIQMDRVTGIQNEILHVVKGMIDGASILSRQECKQLINYLQQVMSDA